MLSAAEIAAMRATQEEALPDQCSIVAPTATATAQGGYKADTLPTGTTENCRVKVLSQTDEGWVGGRYAAMPQYLFTLKQDTVATEASLITYSGEEYQVIGRIAEGEWATAARFVCIRRG